jgi:hypothetical protein
MYKDREFGVLCFIRYIIGAAENRLSPGEEGGWSSALGPPHVL